MIDFTVPLPELLHRHKQQAARDLTDKTKELRETIILRLRYEPGILSTQEGQQLAPEIGKLLKAHTKPTTEEKREAARGL